MLFSEQNEGWISFILLEWGWEMRSQTCSGFPYTAVLRINEWRQVYKSVWADIAIFFLELQLSFLSQISLEILIHTS
jgi:hypothetical protein